MFSQLVKVALLTLCLSACDEGDAPMPAPQPPGPARLSVGWTVDPPSLCDTWPVAYVRVYDSLGGWRQLERPCQSPAQGLFYEEPLHNPYFAEVILGTETGSAPGLPTGSQGDIELVLDERTEVRLTVTW